MSLKAVTFWLSLLVVFLASVNALPDDETEEGPWDSRIRLMKKFGGPDSRIRLTKRFPDSRLRLTKKDRRIRLMKKGHYDSSMTVPFFDPQLSERTSSESDDMMSENATPMNYDSRMDEEIDRIVQLIINRYNNQQSSLIKRGGYIRLV